MDHQAWLNLTREEPIEADLPIIDPHHHLWDYPTSRYLLDEFLADTGSGHRIERTVFVECLSMYRSSGAAEMRPVGETEFISAIAQASAGRSPQVAAGIVAFADLTRGSALAPVLEALRRAYIDCKK